MNPPDDGIELPPPPIIISTRELDDSCPSLELLMIHLDSSAPGSAPADLERRIAHLREAFDPINPDAHCIPPYIKSIQVDDKAIDYCKVRGRRQGKGNHQEATCRARPGTLRYG